MPSPHCLLVRSSVKLFSRFGLFLGRTDTSCHRHFLKEHTLGPYLCTHKSTKSALSHTETESCQSTGSLFPAVKLMPHRNLPCLVFREVSFFLLFSVHVHVCLFLLMGPNSLFVGCQLIVCCLPAACYSAFPTEQKWKKLNCRVMFISALALSHNVQNGET